MILLLTKYLHCIVRIGAFFVYSIYEKRISVWGITRMNLTTSLAWDHTLEMNEQTIAEERYSQQCAKLLKILFFAIWLGLSMCSQRIWWIICTYILITIVAWNRKVLKYEVIIWLQPIWAVDFISYYCVLTSLMTRSMLCIHVLTAPPIVWKPLID
jgi:hypothetical protein